AHLAHIAADVLGADAIDMMTQPSVGSEDFAFYLDVVPGAMFRLGTRSPGQEMTALHTPTFDIDESAIAVGVRLLAQAAIAWFDPERT
ncbi:MAG: M20/M25/M40 family metallo-hydrolase, partial [Pseudomonadales bacterium]